MTKLSDELSWRGMINQTTFSDITDLDKNQRTFYFGIDPSADSMTIGNLAPAMVARQFIEHGHKAILLAGGATGLIGDPDGKKQERDTKDPEVVRHNVTKLTEQIKSIFAGYDIEVVNNYDWFKSVNFLDFMREVGKNVSITQMLDRDFVRDRIGEGGSGISYAEFSYSLIQGYDFLHLFREKGASLQLAGADQWGNSIAGVDLIRRIEGKEAHVFTAPLTVNKQTGIKFGKSEGGAVWLDPSKTSPYKFYQFWLNCDDLTSESLIKIYTLLSKDEVEDIITRHQSAPEQRLLQRTMAHHVTSLIHGPERTTQVERAIDLLFGSLDSSELTDDDMAELAGEIPVLKAGTGLVEALVSSGLARSNKEARQLISSGSVSLNRQKATEDAIISERTLIKKGKNSFILIK